MTTPEQNALRLQIELIESTLKTAERIAFPKKVLATYGTLILLMPLIEILLPSAWWIHVLAYGALFSTARMILKKYFNAWSDSPAHPIVADSLISLQRFTLCSLLLTSYGLSHLGQSALIFPIGVMHVAFLFFSFGKYSSAVLRLASYAQLVVATAFLILMKDYAPAELFNYFCPLFAATFFMGVLAREP